MRAILWQSKKGTYRRKTMLCCLTSGMVDPCCFCRNMVGGVQAAMWDRVLLHGYVSIYVGSGAGFHLQDGLPGRTIWPFHEGQDGYFIEENFWESWQGLFHLALGFTSIGIICVWFFVLVVCVVFVGVGVSGKPPLWLWPIDCILFALLNTKVFNWPTTLIARSATAKKNITFVACRD